MKKTLRTFALTALTALALAGCNSGDTTVTTPPPQLAYTQVDRVGRPLVNTLYATFTRHDVNNRDQPSDDPSTLANDIQAFVTGTNSAAQRSAAFACALAYVSSCGAQTASLLVPDVLRADLSQGGNAGFFGVESGGAIGKPFGGRDPSDDVVDVILGLTYGNLLTKAPFNVPDDGNTNLQKTLQRMDIILNTDNVNAPAGTFSPAFPYLAPPI